MLAMPVAAKSWYDSGATTHEVVNEKQPVVAGSTE